MLRVSLIGPGDVEYHYRNVLKIDNLDKHVLEIARALRDTEIVFLPDRGISFEIAKIYKQIGGRKVIATII
jgi:hypothetical protein